MGVKQVILRLLKISAAAALAAFLVVLVIVDQYGYADRARPADAVVVLGSMVYAGGRLGPALERRAAHAAALYQRGLAPVVICSGGVGTYPPAEAVVLCGRLAALGVPESALLREEQSRNTEQNAAFSAAIMRARGWRTAILASDGFHLYRATQMFERAGLIVYPSPADATSGALNPVERVAREMRETLGLFWFWPREALGFDETRPPGR
jgi:uncharacterized SAM-binding protein YcdF (DUF218 family)